jgi:two-component system OmpR family response regulator
MMRYLIVEHDDAVAGFLRDGLHMAGHRTAVTSNADDAVAHATAAAYDAIVVNLLLPNGEGSGVSRRLREQGVWTPVVLTGPPEAAGGKVGGLGGGADDFLAKPFSIADLLARVSSLVADSRCSVVAAGALRLDRRSRQAWRDKVAIDLSAKEFAVLEILVRSSGQVVSRSGLLAQVWDYTYQGKSNVVDVYVHRLRGKIDTPFGTRSIETVHGQGYRLRASQRGRRP